MTPMFRRTVPLARQFLVREKTLDDPGVYIVYLKGEPFYVGRSRVSMLKRLRAHLADSGSRMIREVPNKQDLAFEYEPFEVHEVPGMEAFVMAALGTRDRGNLRWEIHEDWDLK